MAYDIGSSAVVLCSSEKALCPRGVRGSALAHECRVMGLGIVVEYGEW